MRRIGFLLSLIAAVGVLGGAASAPGLDRPLPLDKRSSFYSFATFTESLSSGFGGPGFGTISGIACTSTTASEPGVFAGNFLLNCDGQGPHNETSIAVNPTSSANVIGTSHSFLLTQVGGSIVAHTVGIPYVTKDGGATWANVHPPLGSYQFTGDAAVTFDADGRAYLANLGDHEGQAGAFTNVSVIAQRSDDGGLHWTDPATVAKGAGAVSPGGLQVVVFNDKEWIAADANPGSPFKNNVYVTWTRFLFLHNQYIESPIFFSRSTDGGQTWTPGKEISGSSAALCSEQVDTSGGATRCDEDQFSQPVVAADGTIYVSFENEQRVNDGQFRDEVLAVKSTDGGQTWSAPVAATPVIHDGISDYPINVDGRQTLTGCQFRTNSAGALAVSRASANAGQLYYVYTENETPGTAGPTQTDILAVTSTNGGATWSGPSIVDSSSADQVYPWAAVGPDGKLRVSFIDRDRTGPAGQSCVYGYSLATATGTGATSFSAPTPLETGLSIASNNRWFSGATNGNTTFIGDYTNVAAGPDGALWADWTDLRQTITFLGRTGTDQDAVAAKVAP
jgi:hypothetical protein